MKKILLLSLLFIPLFCNGQIYFYQDSIEIPKIITLSDLQNYQQECYKDTCWVTYDQWYQDRISCKLGDGDYEIVKERYDLELQRTLFLVRRTPTFDGFVKYLEE
jgi:hypothetical protein